MQYERVISNPNGYSRDRYHFRQDVWRVFRRLYPSMTFEKQPFAFALDGSRIVVRSTLPFDGAVHVPNTKNVGDSCVVVIDLCPTTQSNGKERSIPIEDRKGNITYLAKELAKAGMEIADEAGVEYVSLGACAYQRGKRVPIFAVRFMATVRIVDSNACSKGCFEGVSTSKRFLGFGMPILF